MNASTADRDSILEQLARVLASPAFRRAERSSALLRFLVERTVDGQADRLKEYTLGAEALGRGESFDPRTDTIVRAEASRLRARLENYYATYGSADTVVIALPVGSYVPQFFDHHPAPDAALPIGEPIPLGVSRFSRRTAIAVLGAVVACALAAIMWTSLRGARRTDGTVLQFDVELRSNGVLGSVVGTDVVVSADGTRVVFVARDSRGLAHLTHAGWINRTRFSCQARRGSERVHVSGWSMGGFLGRGQAEENVGRQWRACDSVRCARPARCKLG